MSWCSYPVRDNKGKVPNNRWQTLDNNDNKFVNDHRIHIVELIITTFDDEYDEIVRIFKTKVDSYQEAE